MSIICGYRRFLDLGVDFLQRRCELSLLLLQVSHLLLHLLALLLEISKRFIAFGQGFLKDRLGDIEGVVARALYDLHRRTYLEIPVFVCIRC